MKIDGQEVQSLIELRGVYDGWSVAVMEDGSMVNRWSIKDVDGNVIAFPGVERRFETTQSYLRGEPAEGRWF